MDHNKFKEVFILLILIFAFLVVISQLNCFSCNCNFKCRRNRINAQEIRQNEVVVVGIPVNNFVDGENIVEAFIIE